MRKIVTVTLITLLLLSLCIPAFAEQDPPEAKSLYLGAPGYGWPVNAPSNDSIRPMADCSHSGYPQVSTSYTKQVGCVLRYYDAEYCTHCGIVHDSYITKRETHHVGDCLYTGDGQYICSACGKKWSS